MPELPIEPGLTPKEYKKILSKINLISIRLKSSSSSVKRRAIKSHPKDFTYKIVSKANLSDDNDNELRIEHEYQLQGRIKGDRKIVLRIKANFILTYQAEVKISDDFFAIYAATSLPLNTWPYFRELVSNIASRMELEAITLPLHKN